jgi:hypothetical protein
VSAEISQLNIQIQGQPNTEGRPAISTITIPSSPEGQYLIRTEGQIRKEDFLLDNQTEQSKFEKGRIGRWYINKTLNKLFLRKGCSDARPVYDEEMVAEQNTVAASSHDRDDFSPMYQAEHFQAIVVESHYGNFEPGNRPTGCGGQDTKAGLRSGKIARREHGILNHVDKGIHEDPIINGVLQARDIIDRLDGHDGRVFVTTQNHQTGEIIAVAEYIIENGIEIRRIPISLRPFLKAESNQDKEKAYNPSEIYKDGIPHLPEDKLSRQFKDYLEIMRTKVNHVVSTNPDFSERQKTQEKPVLVITDKQIPLAVRYPTLFGKFGSVFRVNIPRKKVGGETIILDKAVGNAIDQIEYAMTNAIANDGKPGTSFSGSKTLFIETGSFAQSIKIANELFLKDFALEWHKIGGKIFVAETKGAKTIRVEDYIPQLA